MTDGSSNPGQHSEAPGKPGSTKEAIVAFVRNASLEVTMPKESEIEQLALRLDKGTEMFLSDVPRRSPEDVTRACSLISAAGLVPVPHFAVRRFDSAAAFERVLADCVEVGGVRKAMLVSGDYDFANGPFADVAAALRSGLLERRGISAVAIAGYPDGHPYIAEALLDEALTTKLSLLEERGLARQVVTQFGFSPEAIADWLFRQRRSGMADPVSIGMAGPSTTGALLKFAMRCGVRTAARGLFRGGGRSLVQTDCDQLLSPLAMLGGDRRAGPSRAHVFSFGGALRTAAWIDAIQEGRFKLTNGIIQVDTSAEWQ